MKLGDVVLTTGSSSSSSSSTSLSASGFTGIIALNFLCDNDFYYIYDVIKTSDGNYLAACTTVWSYNALVKFNEKEIIWAKSFRIKHEGDWAEGGFVSEIDGAYYTTHKYWTDTESYSSAMIYKIDFDGNEVWHRSSYSCWADDYPRGVVSSLDSTSIIWYYSYYDGGGDFSGGYTPVFYKLNKITGDTEWVRGIKNNGYGVYMQMIHTHDNNYMIGHSSYFYNDPDYLYNADVHYHPNLTKVDSNGNKIWTKYYYRKNLFIIDIITSIKLTADDGFIMLIDAVSKTSNYWYIPYTYDTLVLKVNSSGVPEWCTKIKDTGAQGNNFEDVPCKIHVLDDGYVFNCYDSDDSKHFLIKLNLTGNFVWGKTIDINSFPTEIEGPYNLSSEKTDTGFIVYGQCSGIFGQESILTIHTDFDGNIDNCPYMIDGTTKEIEEGYISEIVQETSYITVINAEYLWTFSQPTASTSFSVEHHILCPGGSTEEGYNCSEYFNGLNGSIPSTAVFVNEYGGEAITIQDNNLSYTPLTNPAPGWEAIRYNSIYKFEASFDFYLSFNLSNLTGGMGGIELYAGDNFLMQILWGGYGMDDPIEYHATGYDDWQYYATTDVTGRLRLRRDNYGYIYGSVWNPNTYRWVWNGSETELYLGRETEALQPWFRIFTYDQSTIIIPEFIVIDGCSTIVLV